MTARTHVVLQKVPHVIVGTPDQVEAALTRAEQDRRLVKHSIPRRHGAFGQVRVDAVLIERRTVPVMRPAQRPARGRTARPRYRVRVQHVVATVGILGPGVALVVAIHYVLAHLALITGALLILAALLLALRSKTGVCMGLHCEGCGHR